MRMVATAERTAEPRAKTWTSWGRAAPLAAPRGGTARIRRHDRHQWPAHAGRHAAPEGVSVDFDLPDGSAAGAGASSPVAWT